MKTTVCWGLFCFVFFKENRTQEVLRKNYPACLREMGYYAMAGVRGGQEEVMKNESVGKCT
jgi:hypothetical protein